MITINEIEKRKIDGSIRDYLIKTISFDKASKNITLECISKPAAQRINDTIEFMQNATGCDGNPCPAFDLKIQKNQIILTGKDLNIAIDFLCKTDFLSKSSKTELNQLLKKLDSQQSISSNQQISSSSLSKDELAQQQLFASESIIAELVKTNPKQAIQILLKFIIQIGVNPQELVVSNLNLTPKNQ